MKNRKTRIASYVGLGVLSVILILTFIFTAIGGAVPERDDLLTAIDFKGTYVADNGETVNIDSVRNFDGKKYEEVVFNGSFSQDIPNNKYFIMPLSNVWAEIQINGKKVAHNYTQQGIKTNTPGISFLYIPGSDIPVDAQVTMTFRNPYVKLSYLNPISVSLDSMGFGDKNAPYIELLHEHSLSIAISIAICVLGLFAFALAGLLWKNILFRNLTLAFMALVGGLFMLASSVYTYIPLWVDNPVICMLLAEFTVFLLPVAAFLYVRQFVESDQTKLFLNIITIGSLILCAVAYLFQLFGFMDVLLSQYYLMLFIVVGILGTIVSLIYEGFFIKSRSTKQLLITLIPLVGASIFDSINTFIAFAPGKSTMRLGLLFTIASQIYFLIVETINHNKEVARYQKMQHELLQMRVAIMVSQIQPHFLYNSLTSIAQLCEKDPPKAKKATIEFADYMRHNMNSLKDEKPVPFETELSHLKVYLSLEKMRFGEDLNIVFDVEVTDFLVPSLAVQPLVENAVKHGVGMKEDGGTVTISTREYTDRFEVIVSDDGVGFDSSEPKNDGRIHVGMDNVRKRIKTMCNGDLEIYSQINKGTIAKIVLPKED